VLPEQHDRAMLAVIVAVPTMSHGGWLRAAAPQRPVLFINPLSGGGKAGHARLDEAARERGVEPVVLTSGDDLEALAMAAVAGGADALGMAGGDGSLAIVASVAFASGLPFVCVPAGTRNTSPAISASRGTISSARSTRSAMRSNARSMSAR
jgi:predicted polyphosphate/ATP-dependent NAD kinase